MLAKVYVVLNKGQHPTSDYFECIAVKGNLEDAKTVIETWRADIMKSIEKDEYDTACENHDEFWGEEIPEEYGPERWGWCIIGTCFPMDYEKFWIEEWEVEV